MSQITVLKDIGLTDQEAIIYLSLLKTGGSTASLVAKDVGIKRTTVYAILKGMTQKGFLTTYYRKSKQFFYAERPQRVANHFEKKIASFVEAIPLLESLEKKQMQSFGLRFIETLDELKMFYKKALDEYKNKEYSIIGNSIYWQGLDPEFFDEFRNSRAKAKIKTRLLLTEESKDTNPTDQKLLRESRLLPKQYLFKSTMDIFPDKVLVVSPELSSLAVVIAVPAMVDVFQGMFQMIWDFVGNKQK